MDTKNDKYKVVPILQQILSDNWDLPDNSFDEVFPSLFIGDVDIAKDVAALEKLKITHVLNAAMGEEDVRYVNTNQKYYESRGLNCQFLGIPAMDLSNFKLAPYFQVACEFIDDAIKLHTGKVLVNCLQGLSRSATLVIAYLMCHKGMRIVDAVRLVHSKRKIYPNDGFLYQLVDLDSQLHPNDERAA